MTRPEYTPATALSVVREISRTEPYGSILAGLARYSRFLPDGLPLNYWSRHVGPNATDLSHLTASAGLASWFTETERRLALKDGLPSPFSYRDRLLLTLTGAVHDAAESELGDPPYGLKTRVERYAEGKHLRDHIGDYAPGLGNAVLKLCVEGCEIAFGDTTTERLPRAFKNIELIGFMQDTGYCLRNLALLEGPLAPKAAKFFGVGSPDVPGAVTQDVMATSLRRLTTEVLGSTVLPKLIKGADEFLTVPHYLTQNAGWITKGMAGVRGSTFDWYNDADPRANPNERERRIKGFLDSLDIWNGWLRQEGNDRLLKILSEGEFTPRNS